MSNKCYVVNSWTYETEEVRSCILAMSRELSPLGLSLSTCEKIGDSNRDESQL